MKRTIFLFAFLQITLFGFSQQQLLTNENAAVNFDAVYQSHPEIPRGILEAVAWNNTRMHHIDANEAESCMGIPKAWGIMGLTLDGKNYFRENLLLVSQLSGYSAEQIITSPQWCVDAYAKAYSAILNQKKKSNKNKVQPFNAELHAAVLYELSEIPDSGMVNHLAREIQVYQIFSFLNDVNKAQEFHFTPFQINLEKHFGDNYKILSARKIIFEEHAITNEMGEPYQVTQKNLRSTEYGPAIWTPAPTCNYSSRNGTAISAITIHTVQGTYAGAISWAQNCASSVSYHYVVRSSDGQITQMVAEANKAWHVGSENPYTIGYEHEGYVSQTGWYTTALYNASADLSRDICNSGYGIPPLRTYYGPSSTGTNTLGGCTKIKGHQHFPNQTHTDPGINWDWELYYRLINNAPTITSVTSSSGNFYDSGGAGNNYSDDERKITVIQPSGATSVTLTFTAFNIEANWDYMYIYNGNSINAPLIGVYTGTTSPGTVTGNTALTIEFRSDCSTTQSGWAASWTSNATPPPPTDNIAPSTNVIVNNTWQTQNFTVNFTDQDNVGGTGIEKSYYQVIDYDGSDWRANADNGFFSDNFDLPNIHADWFTMSGNWNIVNGELVQSDQTNGNTNMYAYLNQSLSNRYLYHWAGKMDGTGTNRRAGLHYFCDDATLSNRGNSYFVWFRLDNDKVQLYDVVNDVFTLVDEVPFNFNANQWYDFKVIYDRITGKHTVYIDNALVQTWTDATPHVTGDYISFRSGECIYTVNNLKIYRSRASSALVTVGTSGDLRYQNQDPLTPAGRIKSIVADNAGNLSAITWQDVNVDWTAPSDVSNVNDGPASDIDISTNANELQANWSNSFDQHSDVARYWYSVGTSAGATDVLNWTDNFWYDTVRIQGLSLNYGSTYFVNVKAENGAGLISGVVSSDGVLIQTPSNPPHANYVNGNTFICAGEQIHFQNNSSDATTFSWTFQNGSPSSSTQTHPDISYSVSGTYTVQLIATGPGGADTLISSINVDVSQPVIADFAVTDTTVYLPNAFVGFTNLSSNANGATWDFGDGNGNSGMNPWHIYTNSGDYVAVLISVNNACPADTAQKIIHVIGTNAIDETALSNFTIVQQLNQIMISTNNQHLLKKIDLYNMEGQLISTYVLPSTSAIIHTSAISAGVYVLRLESDNEIFIQKILISDHE
ncbi:MAG: N-acetylmuramoyl-L-alanine amidase [Flavobacteriales bacterium]|nr:N-acetylmuramoyl-L-alanine amidase [Flavobacteriales bacterium]